jgi:predicted RNA-binding Zn-ribbon protein involved in translation (DUF1610 family)
MTKVNPNHLVKSHSSGVTDMACPLCGTHAVSSSVSKYLTGDSSLNRTVVRVTATYTCKACGYGTVYDTKDTNPKLVIARLVPKTLRRHVLWGKSASNRRDAIVGRNMPWWPIGDYAKSVDGTQIRIDPITTGRGILLWRRRDAPTVSPVSASNTSPLLSAAYADYPTFTDALHATARTHTVMVQIRQDPPKLKLLRPEAFMMSVRTD